MGLSDAVARWAGGRAHVLVVEAPGWWRTRAAVERMVLTRGWSLAFSPADADVLVVCGEPGTRLGEAVELVWHQMPGPRVRVDVGEGDDVVARLDEAYAGLLESSHHRHDAQHRPSARDLLAEQDKDRGGQDHDKNHGGGHTEMDHGGMDTSSAGIPLAEGGEDRDGLEMDVLQVRLGPVLPFWPPGLALRCALQGDVVVEAQAELVDGDQPRQDESLHARHLDNLASLLALAGWDDAAAEARVLRDVILQTGGEPAADGVERLRRRVRRSWTLRWSLRGIRPLTAEEVCRHGLPPTAVGDTYDRLLGMVDRAAASQAVDPRDNAVSVVSTDHVARLVVGLDLAAARLVVASLDIDQLQVGCVDHGVSHG